MLWSPRARTPREPVENPATSLFAAPVRTVMLPKKPRKIPFSFHYVTGLKASKDISQFLQLFLPFISLFLQLLTRKSLFFFFHFSAVSLFLLLFPFSILFLLFTCACLLFDSRSSCCLPFSPAHSSLSSFLFLLPALL